MKPKLRAVIFDIYGTLLKSAAGEIHPDPKLRALIEEAHAASPHPFPEVDIREIHAALHPQLSPQEIERLAMDHEQAANPVSGMPGAAETLRRLSAMGLVLGVISNAQFYTIPLLEGCLGASVTELGFDPGLTVLSYTERRAKPDTWLFEVMRDRLLEKGIQPHEALYVGNDVRNDIDPAKRCGFRAALFTGDVSSLRLRGRSLENCGADLILASLGELPGRITG
ncbi:HAD family hydrolase [Luteolibacter flavescens]|uniref:HAD family hydrolase n=1 Tax=Luteolibacter flavescens TaxID=1859460 RepID=A0ABT3FS84_9BACT|nr:HAD family hydrolase [Luteolibacter flavescens]MCW1886430.1 HAD family hydrolase [Luteolibacter flavescens]